MVELQLLRQGPPHNQLLSPLTDYIALCGDHPNTTLNFPLEHDSLRVRLYALRYKDSEDTRRIQLADTARVVGQMLAEVPGLISEFGQHRESKETVVHLSVAMTASELTLVPFELAHSPPGFPGAGGPLCLQNDFPVCITRRSRNVRFNQLDWGRPPRILMIASDAAGAIPVDQHYAALRKLVEPFTITDPVDPDSSASLEEVRERLVLLTDANARSIQETIAKAKRENRPFTHIHILAHGCRLPRSKESYGVGLHTKGKGSTGIDAVDGRRLGQLLTGDGNPPTSPRTFDSRHRPNVVTLTVCDSANTGFDVSAPGGNVALSLHEAGIPLVVGSQFPLTFGGSVVLVEGFYKRLLEGEDPRWCLWATRQDLFAQNAEKLKTSSSQSTASQGRHDWCSMLAFAALPPDAEEDAKRFRDSQQQLRMDSKLRAGDRLISMLGTWESGLSGQNPDAIVSERVGSFVEEIEKAMCRFDDFVCSEMVPSIGFLGVSAGANKRCAELIYAWQQYRQGSGQSEVASSECDYASIQDGWLRYLQKALLRYQMIRTRDRNCAWAFVQCLFLRRFLTFYYSDDDFSSEQTEEELFQEWFKTKYICEDQELPHEVSGPQVAWHLTDMIELALLRPLIGRFRGKSKTMNILREEFSERNVFKWLRRMDHLSQSTDESTQFAIYSGQKQLRRYRTFAEMLCPQVNKEEGFEFLPKEFRDLYVPLERYLKAQERRSL